MKRRTTPLKRTGQSPYKRHEKHAFDYGAMYSNCPHLRRPQSGSKTGEYAPHVHNHLYQPPRRDVVAMPRGRDTIADRPRLGPLKQWERDAA